MSWKKKNVSIRQIYSVEVLGRNSSVSSSSAAPPMRHLFGAAAAGAEVVASRTKHVCMRVQWRQQSHSCDDGCHDSPLEFGTSSVAIFSEFFYLAIISDALLDSLSFEIPW